MSKARKTEAASQETDINQLLAKHEGELSKITEELEELTNKCADEVTAIHQKYSKLRRPVYVKRAAILKKIPKIWPTILVNHPSFSHVLGDNDVAALQFLEDVDVIENDDIQSGFKLVLVSSKQSKRVLTLQTFGKNPFFKNSSLTFTIESTEGEAEPKIEFTPIEWHEGKNFTVPAKGKKREADSDTFFGLYSQSSLEFAQIAEMFRNEIFPDPFEDDSDDDDDVQVLGDDGESEDGEGDDDDE